MSKDIRSFFTKVPSAKSKVSKDETSPDMSKKRKKRVIVLSSDSEDEVACTPSKKKKSPAKVSKALKKQDSPKKLAEISKAGVSSMFGDSPVKRVPQKVEPKVPKKKPVQEQIVIDDEDDLFAEALSQVEEQSTPKIGTQSSPRKESPRESRAFRMSLSPSPTKSPDSPTKQTKSPVKSKTQRLSLSPSPSKTNSQPTSPAKGRITSFFSTTPTKVSPNEKANKPTKPIVTNGSKRSTVTVESSQDSAVCSDKDDDLMPKEPKFSQSQSSFADSGTFSQSVNSQSSRAPSPSKPTIHQPKFDLWVEKYKPTTLKQIIGQQGEKSNANKLLFWLKNWYKNRSGNKKFTKPSPWAKDDTGAYFKAALLSGPPGVGKTTTAHLVCRELGMDTVEFNASDTRSKSLLSQEVSELLSSTSLSPFFKGQEVTKQRVLIMDEVDGMAGNEDRGGIQELIQLIKNSKVPIICMCNDRAHPKIRSLVNYCFDLRFSKPRLEQIKGAMMSVCFKEKLKIKPEVLAEIINSANQDVRLTLNHLSMYAAQSSRDLQASTKDIKIGPWDVLRQIFSKKDHQNMTIHDMSDLFFHDYSLTPLFVHENYLSVVPGSELASSKKGKIELFSKAATSLANGDLIENCIRRNGSWNLLPAQAIFSSVVPGYLLEGHMGGMINFPAWFGKNSKRGKVDRLAQEIQIHTRLKATGSKEAINLDYARALRDLVCRPLVQEGSEGAGPALQVLHEYSLVREDIESLTELTSWPNTRDPFTSLDPKVKAAFTRAYNKNPVITPFKLQNPVKKSKGGGVDAEDGGSGDEVDDVEEDDNLELDGMIRVKKKTGKTAGSDKAESSKPGTSGTRGGKRGGKKGKK